MKIAILYVCTGKYNVFWRDFYLSCEKNFIKNAEKEYFVFSDSEKIDFEEFNNIHKIFQEDLGWPNNTLKRYDFFYSKIDELKNSDYIFFFNANLLFIEEISDSEFLPSGTDKLVGCKHPGFFNKDVSLYPYENNIESKAYLDKKYWNYYYQGAINGGNSKEFIEAIVEMKKNIEIDLSKNIIAVWHDESHWNKYLNERKDITKTLDPSYLYPENYNNKLTPKIFIRNKDQFGNISSIRNTKIKINKDFLINILLRIKNKLLYTGFRFYDSIFYSKNRIFNLKKININSDRKISVVITYYNRHNTIHKALYHILNDERVDEILIVDDFSSEESFSYLEEFAKKINDKKIKIVRNEFNLGMYRNKINSIKQAKNDWLILLDSDNTITKAYLDSIFFVKNWDKNEMFCPSFAWPLINNEELSGKRYDFSVVRELLIHNSKRIKSFLNLGNFFVNRDSFVAIMNNYLNIVPFAADSIFINYCWISNGGTIYIPKNCRYIHRVNLDSTWKIQNMESVIKFENIKNSILILEKDPNKAI